MTSFRIGDIEITRVPEFCDPEVPVKFLLPDLPQQAIAENLDWLAPRFFDADKGTVAIHMQSWLIRTGSQTILVDTCGGNHKPREHFPVFHMADRPYLENLKAAGADPQDIDVVFCTHLHIDHVGWNTRLENGRWVPTFPNARYLFSRKDYDHYDPRQRTGDGSGGGAHVADEIFNDSVLPVVESGLADLVDGVHAINDHLTIEPAPGHSPGHSLLSLKSGDETGLFTGDIMHHPLQVAVPDCNSFACADATQARATRKAVLDRCCENRSLLVPGHFAAPHRGFIGRKGRGFAFSPAD